MPQLKAYDIALKDLSSGIYTFDYELDNDYFKAIDSAEVQGGNVKAQVTISAHAASFDVKLDVDGCVFITCDHCLDEMEQPICGHEELTVKFGNTYDDDGEVVVVPEADGILNVAWLLYEVIALAIPIQHVHQQGLCNQAMEDKLKSHLTCKKNDNESEDTPIDPRWDCLKSILK